MTFVEGAAAWATSSGPPNWVFVVALLTSPSRWTSLVMTQLKQRFGGD